MLTVVNLKETTIQSIQEGKAYKGKGSVAFESRAEAQEWANNHIGHGDYYIFPLCPDCEENSFLDTPKLKYPTMKSILKPIKILPNG